MKYSVLTLVACLLAASPASAQKIPEAGYVFPAGGKAGTTVDVQLGGHDWTPDMEYFSLDKRVQLTVSGPPGAILIPPPPYWFGAKSRIVANPLPREVPAKFVIPADMPAGTILWQAANANGCTSPRVFVVGSDPEVIEDEARKTPQLLASLPVTVSGRLYKNEEVDRYRFVAAKDGPVTCDLVARRLGSKFHPILEVRDAGGRLLADATGAGGTDPSITFAAQKGSEYIVSLQDVDFGGDRSYVYRLGITPGPRVVGAIPAAGRRGETREVEFVGYGVATGAVKLESVKRTVTFPAAGAHLDYRLETPFGAASAFRIPLSDLTERIPSQPKALVPPVAITGVLDERDVEDDYYCTWKKGEVWSLKAEARALGSPLDVAIAIFGPDGKEVARNDDLPETTDAGLDFIVPANGAFRIVISDMAGHAGNRAAIYRLAVQQRTGDFELQTPLPRVSVPLGGKFDLPVKAIRKGGFSGPIALTLRGLPAGITAPPDKLVIPAGTNDLAIPLTAAADAAALAGIVTIEGTANVTPRSKFRGGSAFATIVTRTAHAKATFNLAPRSPEETHAPAILVASVLKPRFKGRVVDADTGRKVHRGSTFPADVIVERLEGFQGEVILQMAATQSYQVQGISGSDVKVPPGTTQTIFPCYMPEWLETIRTSRMGVIVVGQVPDPKGKVRWAANEIYGFITMTMEGALLKVSADEPEMVVPAGKPFDVRLKVSRLIKLAEPVKLELKVPTELTGLVKSEPIVVPVGTETATFRITPTTEMQGVHTFTIRGTALQDGKYAAISEATVSVEFLAGSR